MTNRNRDPLPPMSDDSPALPPEIAALIDAYRDALLRQEPPGRAMKGTRRIHLARETDSARSALETAITALVRDGERYRFLLDHDLRGGDRGMREGVHPDVFGRWVDSAMTAAARAASTPTPKGLRR